MRNLELHWVLSLPHLLLYARLASPGALRPPDVSAVQIAPDIEQSVDINDLP